MADPLPFNIKIFVAEGLADGLRVVEKSNWVGRGIICPRSRYPHVKKRKEFDRTGVYLLLGQEEDTEGVKMYVGEADGLRCRLDEHHAKKDFWQQAVVFTTTGDPLNKAEVQYLEARLVELATKAKRCKLENGNSPQRPALTEADEAQAEGFLQELLSLLPVIGIDAFKLASSEPVDQRLYYLKGPEAEATGFESPSGFVVRAGSTARAATAPSMAEHVPGYFRRREQLLRDGVLLRAGDGLRFEVDYLFSSPSFAAAVCLGRNANGRLEWKDDDGITLKAHQEKESRA